MKIGLVAPVKPSHPYLENDPAPLFDLHYLHIPPWLWFSRYTALPVRLRCIRVGGGGGPGGGQVNDQRVLALFAWVPKDLVAVMESAPSTGASHLMAASPSTIPVLRLVDWLEWLWVWTSQRIVSRTAMLAASRASRPI